MFPFSQQNFLCFPLLSKTLKLFFSISVFPFLKVSATYTAFVVPVYLALFSFCFVVPNNFLPCSLVPLGEPHFPFTSLHPPLEIRLGSSISHCRQWEIGQLSSLISSEGCSKLNVKFYFFSIFAPWVKIKKIFRFSPNWISPRGKF